MRPSHIALLPLLALFLAACGGGGAAVAPELIVKDAVSARAFGDNQCYVTLPPDTDAYLNPNPEQPPVGQAVGDEAEAVQVVVLADGGVWYQLVDGVWVRLDEAETRGDCAP